MENMFSLLEVSQVSKDNLEDIPQSNVAEIRFDKVSFDYDIRRTIIKNISFTVPNGKKVANSWSYWCGKINNKQIVI